MIAEEPKSGFIDFNRIYNTYTNDKRLVHHHGGHDLRQDRSIRNTKLEEVAEYDPNIKITGPVN